MHNKTDAGDGKQPRLIRNVETEPLRGVKTPTQAVFFVEARYAQTGVN
jgi:hypothetical protein